jgi:hypothetical protein
METLGAQFSLPGQSSVKPNSEPRHSPRALLVALSALAGGVLAVTRLRARQRRRSRLRFAY